MRGLLALALALGLLAPSSAAFAQGGLTIQKVADAFEDVCVRQAPDFRRSRGLMAKHGLTDERSAGTVYHPSGAISIKVQIVRRGETTERLRCSLVYELEDAPAASAAMEQIAIRLGEDAWDRREIVTQDGRDMVVWRVLAADKQGELFHVPFRGLERDGLGIMVIQF